MTDVNYFFNKVYLNVVIAWLSSWMTAYVWSSPFLSSPSVLYVYFFLSSLLDAAWCFSLLLSPGCSRLCPLLLWHFHSPRLLGFLCLLWATSHVPQPGVVDLLVSWKPRGTSGRPITSLRFSICVIIRSTKQISGWWCWTMESALKLQVQIFTFKALCSRE